MSITEALPYEVLDYTKWREKWRFIELHEPLGDDEQAFKGGQTAGVPIVVPADSAFMKWALESGELTAAAGRHRVQGVRVDVFRPCRRPRQVEEYNGAVPALPQTLAWPSR